MLYAYIYIIFEKKREWGEKRRYPFWSRVGSWLSWNEVFKLLQASIIEYPNKMKVPYLCLTIPIYIYIYSPRIELTSACKSSTYLWSLPLNFPLTLYFHPSATRREERGTKYPTFSLTTFDFWSFTTPHLLLTSSSLNPFSISQIDDRLSINYALILLDQILFSCFSPYLFNSWLHVSNYYLFYHFIRC